MAAVWTRPRGKAKEPAVPEPVAAAKGAVAVALSAEHLQHFVNAYQEKNQITAEIRSIEAKAQHGIIPRRRYKVQRKSLEQRIAVLDHEIADLKLVMRKAGGAYPSMIKEFEAAEVALEEADMGIKNLEVKHESGEVSADDYPKQLSELERDKETAQNAVDELCRDYGANVSSYT